MSQDPLQPAIDLVVGQVSDLNQQLIAKKRLANDLCQAAGREPIYSGAELSARAGAKATRPDEYYGKPLATVVRMVLEKRETAGLGAATVSEIYDEMIAGGYNFGGKNDDNNKRGLYISLGKNTTTFHKLPNGTYGLLEWYPDAKVPKAKNGNGKAEKPLHEELQEGAASDAAEENAAQLAKAK